VVFDTTSNKPYYDDGSNLKVIGSGSGGASNLIEDGDAEAGITNFVEGSYTAATRPAGTFTASSGAGTFAISTSTSSPIFGNTSFLLTKSTGASRQGRAIERTIPIDLGYRTKMLKTRIDYTIVSGTFVAGSNSTDSSLIWYIGQFNGSTWSYTEPSSFKMFSNSTTNSDWVEGEFQVNADTTQIKLIAYVAETANSAWVVKAEVGIRPSTILAGTTITDWVSYTPTGSWSTNTTYTGRWRRVGDNAEYNVGISLAGAPTAANLTVNLASGHVIDTTKFPLTPGANDTVIGKSSANDSGTSYSLDTYYSTTTAVTVKAIATSATWGSGGTVSNTVPVTFGASDTLNILFQVPITGWSSSSQVSDGYDGRQIGFRANNSSTTINSTPAKIVWTNTNQDDVAGYSSGTYTIRSAGWYDVSAALYVSGTPSVDQTSQLYIYRNGAAIKAYTHRYKVASATTTSIGPVADSFYFNAGDTVEIYASSEITTPAISSSTTLNTFFIGKRQAPTTISATEVVAMRYTLASATAIGTSAAVLPYTTKVFDTHNAYNTTTGLYTCPVYGFYQVNAMFTTTGVTIATTNGVDLYIRKDGVDVSRKLVLGNGATTVNYGVEHDTLIECNAGQTIGIYPVSAVATTAVTSAILNVLSIARIK
jgi:hypothetical protein